MILQTIFQNIGSHSNIAVKSPPKLSFLKIALLTKRVDNDSEGHPFLLCC